MTVEEVEDIVLADGVEVPEFWEYWHLLLDVG